MFNIINYIIPRSMHEQFYGVISLGGRTPNQTRAAIPPNITQTILHQHASATQSATVSRELPSETPSNTQVVAQTILNETPARRSLEGVLNKWAGDDTNRIRAATKISTCVRERNYTLDLSSLDLTSLPDIFSCRELQHLRTLHLNNNQLTTLPESIGHLTALQWLWLKGNHLTALPESTGQLTALQELILNNNQLTILPESIGGLTALHSLYLSENHLTVLPESIGRLTALHGLDLGDNQLTALPESIGHLTALQGLWLKCNHLTALPESIGHLTALQGLWLKGNHLTALPESISQLTALQTLDLRMNLLTTLPESIGHLTALQRLYLINNHLTALPNFLRALPNLHVHDLPFSVNIESITEEICRLAQVEPSEALKQLYAKATDGDDGQKALLRAWLSRLKDTAPGMARDVNFYKSIVKILELASIDISFQPIFWTVIAEATSSCGDRMALSILELDIERQLITLDPQKHQQVADFLKRGRWIYRLLKEIAENKVLTLRAEGTHFDEIEVHLGYFIKLKEDLNLPITMQDMLYFRCSTLTGADLIAAKTHILEQIGNEDAFVDFLIREDKWKETLSINCLAEFDAIQKAYENSEEEDSIEVYETALKNLTRNLLSKPETKLVEDASNG